MAIVCKITITRSAIPVLNSGFVRQRCKKPENGFRFARFVFSTYTTTLSFISPPVARRMISCSVISSAGSSPCTLP